MKKRGRPNGSKAALELGRLELEPGLLPQSDWSPAWASCLARPKRRADTQLYAARAPAAHGREQRLSPLAAVPSQPPSMPVLSTWQFVFSTVFSSTFSFTVAFSSHGREHLFPLLLHCGLWRLQITNSPEKIQSGNEEKIFLHKTYTRSNLGVQFLI